VQYALGKDLINLFPGNTFHPERAITRAEVCKVVSKLLRN